MGCRVGITTDVISRMKEYIKNFDNINGWKTFGSSENRVDARNWVKIISKAHCCEGRHGGKEENQIPGQWYGYHFYY